MNTEQDDREQIEFMKEWVRKKEEKKRVREIRAKLRRESEECGRSDYGR